MLKKLPKIIYYRKEKCVTISIKLFIEIIYDE